MSSPQQLRPLAARSAVIAATVLAIVAVAGLVVASAHVMFLIFAGLLLAVLLSAAADGLAQLVHLPRSVALAVAVLVIAGLLAGTTVALWPSVSTEADQLATQLPAAVAELRQWLEQRDWGRWLVGRAEPGQMADGQGMVTLAGGLLASWANALGGLIVMLFVGLYVAAQPDPYRRGLLRLVPPAGRGRLDAVLVEVTGVLRWWLAGTLLSMTLVGVLTTVGLWLLGVPLALTFGLFAALMTFIPNIGPVLSVIPPTLIALADDPQRAWPVIGLYLGIQVVESYAVTPLIHRRTIAMPPALTIASQVVLGLLAGAIGVIVATPLTAVAMTMIRRLYVEDLLEGGGRGVVQPVPPPA